MALDLPLKKRIEIVQDSAYNRRGVDVPTMIGDAGPADTPRLRRLLALQGDTDELRQVPTVVPGRPRTRGFLIIQCR